MGDSLRKIMPQNCIFCRIAAGKAPASVVCENELVMAFMDIGQANPGHVLVAPKQHVRDIYELDIELCLEVEGEEVTAPMKLVGL